MTSKFIILIASIVLAILIIMLGFVVLKSDYRKKINCTFFVMALFIALWALFYVISIFPEYSSLLIVKITDVFGLIGAVQFLHFSLFYPKVVFVKASKLLSIVSITVAIFLVPIILFSTFIVKQVELSKETATPIMGNLVLFFFLANTSYLLIGSMILIYKFIKIYKTESIEKHQLKFVVSGFTVTALLLSITSILILMFGKNIGWSVDALTPFIPVIFIIFTAYGILKGGLFDVRTAIVRSVTYSLVIATLAGIYVGATSLLSGVLGLGQSSVAELGTNVVISLTLVLLFQPLKRFFDKYTNKIFYKDNYNTDEFVARLNRTLALTTDLRSMLEKTAAEIAKTLKGDQVFFFINSDESHHIAAGTAGHVALTKAEVNQFGSVKKTEEGIIIASLLDESEPIKQLLNDKKLEIILPLTQDNETVGYLILGEHKTSGYTTRDIRVLSAVSNGLLIAIQNALAVQEIRDFNITLRQKIAEATQELRIKNAMLKKLDKAKDEFVSMASHQLRTPLTSVKGYLSMVIEGDAGKLSKPQKDLLEEAYTSNEKMVHLVNDFLNVSRIQTGKFMLEKLPTDLSKLVTEEIDGLRQNAKAHNINLVFKAPTGLPTLNVDEGKIRQVVMNFADNALYYSHPDTDVNINLSVDGDDILFTVKDMGIGVPIDEQGQLFTKFYRASNARKARPDGTGVGLYLAKKIISAHDGKIVFETAEGKGSTFGFRLPIKELESSSDEAYNLKE